MDGGGLFLQVRKDGSKYWVHRFQMNKRRTDMGLGRYPTITISQAREKHDANERRIANGINPVSVKASATASMMTHTITGAGLRACQYFQSMSKTLDHLAKKKLAF